MKAISLWQPWATLIALGHKKFETRSWGTSYRGPLAIHAAKRQMKLDELRLLSELKDPLDFGLEVSDEPADYPLGVIVCTARLVACHSISSAQRITLLEMAVGDWTPGRYAWELADIKQLEPPVPARGAQGLWEWTP